MLPITFLSDYGYENEYVGVCHGVIERIAPGATVIDIAHAIPPQDIRAGALVLRNAIPFLPEGIHMAIVDPGVGSERRPVALRCDNGNLFVGPDNGLLTLGAAACSGVEAAVDLSSSSQRLESVSATFHGRDVFAPVAAQLAREIPIELTGERIDSDGLVELELPEPEIKLSGSTVHVLVVDRFGNLQLNLDRELMSKAGFLPGGKVRVETNGETADSLFGRTFADVEAGEVLLFEDSSGAISLAVNKGSAAERFGLSPDAELRLLPAP